MILFLIVLLVINNVNIFSKKLSGNVLPNLARRWRTWFERHALTSKVISNANRHSHSRVIKLILRHD